MSSYFMTVCAIIPVVVVIVSSLGETVFDILLFLFYFVSCMLYLVFVDSKRLSSPLLLALPLLLLVKLGV